MILTEFEAIYMNNEKRAVLVLPGLGDETKLVELMTCHWAICGYDRIVVSAKWEDDESIDEKKQRLKNKMEELWAKDRKTEIVGCSAGGPLALLLFLENRNRMCRVTNICGRLSVGPKFGWRGFVSRTDGHLEFGECVKESEARIKTLDSDVLRQITCVSAGYDELVPRETSEIEGARNLVFGVGHLLTIAIGLVAYPWLNFDRGR